VAVSFAQRQHFLVLHIQDVLQNYLVLFLLHSLPMPRTRLIPMLILMIPLLPERLTRSQPLFRILFPISKLFLLPRGALPSLFPRLFVFLFYQDWDLVNKLVILVCWILLVHAVDALHVDSQDVCDLFAGIDVGLYLGEDCFESVEAFGFPAGLGCGLVFLWLFGLGGVPGLWLFASYLRYRLIFEFNSTPSPPCQ
jgi:hypothetical protein